MGALTTSIAFGAGYVLGAKRDTETMTRIRSQIRGAVTQRLPGSRGVTDVRQVRDVMTPMPETLSPDDTLVVAAQRMADGAFGDVLVAEPSSGTLLGIVTDRDITIRAVAAERDASTTTLRSILSDDLETLSPDDTLEVATQRMRAAKVRRLPVTEAGKPVGTVSLGDLSLTTDTNETLADITLAAPDR
jgi:CBS domain-containing protein